ncbi:putative lipoprotein [Oceaniovalibus guishaninsula JLT2003]|uniref:Putative lipoprotein n=1 Tax=Oceaniovalibus guishaninsula JLT2003 TaxID=1231392 RepID=K2I5J8_9RHOB|nr:DUF192 domain-containing protein [Oceaniovalibus guishaninsula]EKE44175.1 putative lipoprotein [Oceaniovalibus guishaninsula JLT2003]
MIRLAFLLALWSGCAQAACQPGRVELRGDWGQAAFAVEIADDPAERAQGLMNRPSMPRGAGMLFIYEQPQRASFWMRNTLIPLDMIFVGADGIVRRIHENAVPLDETPIPGGDGVLAVLEINGGLAGQLGISEGSQLRHPGLPQDLAVWPCE